MKRFSVRAQASRLLSLLLIVNLAVPCRAEADASIQAADEEPVKNVYAAGEAIARRIDAVVGAPAPIHVQSFNVFGGKNLGVSQAIANSLKSMGYTNSPNAEVEVEGRLFREPAQTSLPLTGYKVKGTIVFRSGKEQQFDLVVKNDREGHGFTSKTGDILPPPRGASNFVNTTTPQPRPFVSPMGWVRASPESAYAVRIKIRQPDGSFAARRATMIDGEPHIRLERGEVYAIEVFNGTPYDAGASIFIDGVSRYATAEDPEMKRFVDILPPYSATHQGTRLFSGYVKNASEGYEFKVFEPAKALVLRVAPEAAKEMGTISVTFSAAWNKGESPPPFEPAVQVARAPQGRAGNQSADDSFGPNLFAAPSDNAPPAAPAGDDPFGDPVPAPASPAANDPFGDPPVSPLPPAAPAANDPFGDPPASPSTPAAPAADDPFGDPPVSGQPASGDPFSVPPTVEAPEAAPAAPSAGNDLFGESQPLSPGPPKIIPPAPAGGPRIAVGSGPGSTIASQTVRLSRDIGAVRSVIKLRYYATR